jgi:glycosyltransferase involved in cell wall biosynthesis
MGTNFGMTGVETFMLQLCAAQKRIGLAPTIALDLETRGEVARRGAALGVTVSDFPQRSTLESRLPQKIGTALLRSRRVGSLALAMRDVDVLHMHSVGMVGVDALVAAPIAGRHAVVVTHHLTRAAFTPLRTRLGDFTEWLHKRVPFRSVMPYSAASSELVASGFPAERVTTIPFCCDETLFKGSVTPPRPGELKLVMAARLFSGKGHDTLLAAVAQLAPAYPGLRLVLVGDGPLRVDIEATIAQLGLSDVVELRGLVPHEAMPEILRDAHVIVLPSNMPGETFPISLLEGMALGLPAIGTRWFGIPDIIVDGESGFLVEPGNADALAQAIERYLTDPACYALASQKARERVRMSFTGTAVARRYADLYAAALAGRAGLARA